MDSVESIAAYSTALSQAQLQAAVGTKVLKLAQGQDQVIADLLSSTMENLQQTIESAATSTSLDTYA